MITDLEKRVILNIIESEYMGCDDKRMINYPVWTFSVTNEKKNLAGALGSLVKKGYCFVETDKDDRGKQDSVCGLTKKGFIYAKKNKLIKEVRRA